MSFEETILLRLKRKYSTKDILVEPKLKVAWKKEKYIKELLIKMNGQNTTLKKA